MLLIFVSLVFNILKADVHMTDAESLARSKIYEQFQPWWEYL